MKIISCFAVIILVVFSLSTCSVFAVTIHVPSEQPSIQTAINAASDGDLVLVASGTYFDCIDFRGKAITVQGEAGVDGTVIDGLQHTVVRFDSGETLDSIIDGFTIRNGQGTDGGGILCRSSSPTIEDCLIIDNCASYDGGGIFCEDNASPMIISCSISGNLAGRWGAGIFCWASSPTITNCTISENWSDSSGGGIRCDEDASPTITNCTISGNRSESGGGAISSSDSFPSIMNCILWGDAAPSGPEIYASSGTPMVTYSDVQGGWPGEGNIDADPLWIGTGDYHLTAGSPCIDAGTDAGVYTDSDGDVRPQGASFDMGADEYPECWDGDSDGYGHISCGGLDCDDTDAGVNPGVKEICAGGIDEDCDGFIDTDDSECVILHVPADQPTIQGALDVAGDGSLVMVAPGTYVENIHFHGRAIRLESEGGAEVTVIDGNQEGSVVTLSYCETKEAVLEGFTVRNGRGSRWDPELGSFVGGGIYCRGSSLTVRNCMISGNTAFAGGGLYFLYSSPTIDTCSILGNSARGAGGGIYCRRSFPAIMNSTITGNTGDDGSGIYCDHSFPMITSTRISGNSARYGGGLYCDDSNPTIMSSTISDNNAASFGGGIYCLDSSPTVTNCTISGNIADGYGGGLALLSDFSSRTFPQESPKVENSGFRREVRSSPTITNCTISGNYAGYGGALYCCLASPTITNCILWGDSSPYGPEIYESISYPEVTYSDVQGGWPGEGNIDADPLFVMEEDFHLNPGSPCIDAGIAADIPVDIDGDVRPYGAGFDMGADEYTGEYWALVMETSYVEGSLNLEFILGLPEPATWTNYLILLYPTVQVLPLWTVPLPVIMPPVALPTIAIPFPSVGWIGIWTGLFTAEGAKADDFGLVDTG